ncbi:hypothetical protein, partial [Streptomyces albospinus]|uniref:hypothetical protein n=1 Tax=Streptomyces albospinus TaxID=285515 RepID=UPI00167139F4
IATHLTEQLTPRHQPADAQTDGVPASTPGSRSIVEEVDRLEGLLSGHYPGADEHTAVELRLRSMLSLWLMARTSEGGGGFGAVPAVPATPGEILTLIDAHAGMSHQTPTYHER